MLVLRDIMPSFTDRKKYLKRKSKVFQLFETAGKRNAMPCLVIESGPRKMSPNTVYAFTAHF